MNTRFPSRREGDIDIATRWNAPCAEMGIRLISSIVKVRDRDGSNESGKLHAPGAGPGLREFGSVA